MKIRNVTSAAASRGDAVYVLAHDGRVDVGDALKKSLQHAKATGDMKTSFRAARVFHQPSGSPFKRLGVVGLGKTKDIDSERLRRAAAVAQGSAAALEVSSFSLSVSVFASLFSSSRCPSSSINFTLPKKG